MDAWYATTLDIEEVLAGTVEGRVHIFVADVIESFQIQWTGTFWTVLHVGWV